MFCRCRKQHLPNKNIPDNIFSLADRLTSFVQQLALVVPETAPATQDQESDDVVKPPYHLVKSRVVMD